MSTEENKNIIHRFYEEWNRGNLDGIAALLADDVIDHNPQPGQPAGKKGLVEGLRPFMQGFPDLNVTVDHMVGQGDRVFDTGRARGTHRGTFVGIPATNKPVDFTYSDIYRIKNGKIVEVWHIEDIVTMMQQIGVMPQLGNQPQEQPGTSSTTRTNRGRPEPGTGIRP